MGGGEGGRDGSFFFLGNFVEQIDPKAAGYLMLQREGRINNPFFGSDAEEPYRYGCIGLGRVGFVPLHRDLVLLWSQFVGKALFESSWQEATPKCFISFYFCCYCCSWRGNERILGLMGTNFPSDPQF